MDKPTRTPTCEEVRAHLCRPGESSWDWYARPGEPSTLVLQALGELTQLAAKNLRKRQL